MHQLRIIEKMRGYCKNIINILAHIRELEDQSEIKRG